MTYGICHLSIVPVRSEPAHRSEMVSQLLFGEHFSIITTENDWLKIHCSFDEYEGWIHKSQQQEITVTDHQELQRANHFLSYDLVQILLNHQSIYSVVLGSTLPWYRSGSCRIASHNFTFEGNARQPSTAVSGKMVIENAFMYLNAPYLWGGRSPFGIDCSGFTQMVYKLCGFKLKRDAWMQAELGQTIHLLDEAQPGDLAFFDNEEGRITHTGIIISRNRIIHASGQVRTDSLDHHGIFNNASKKYTHNLRLIKRVL